MNQNKTEFRFTVNGDMGVVDTIIRNWLMANKFSYQPKPGANYFAYNDPMIKGKRGFEYYINGNTVIILAYLGTFEKPKALEGFVGAVMKQDYRSEMTPLFEEIKKVESGNYIPQPQNYNMPQNGTSQNIIQQNVPPMANDSLNTFMEENNKKQETMVIIGFIMSVVSILISCIGMTYGVILIILEYYFAIQGLKTSKRGLAIATIVLASLAIVMFIFFTIVYAVLA